MKLLEKPWWLGIGSIFTIIAVVVAIIVGIKQCRNNEPESTVIIDSTDIIKDTTLTHVVETLPDTAKDTTIVNLPPDTEITILDEWLYVYPEDIGPVRYVPEKTIQAINRQKKYGYNDWRLPTMEELEVLSANISKLKNRPIANKYYLSDEISFINIEQIGGRCWERSAFDLKNRKKITTYEHSNEQLEKEVQVRLVREDR